MMLSSDIIRALDTLVAQDEFDESAGHIAQALRVLLPRLPLPRTPAGTKELKTKAESMLWVLSTTPGPGYLANLQADWSFLRPRFSELLAAFGAPSKQTPTELVLSGITYKDGVGMGPGKLQGLATRFDSLWDRVRGWRRLALRPGMTVLFAGPKEFRGTSSGKYRQDGDVMMVRATPKIFARPTTAYAGLDYILLHELGHRYERFARVPLDFDKPEWFTTKYSRTDSASGSSEAFAELFALGILDIRGTWGDVMDRFEAVMEGRPMLARILAWVSVRSS